MILRIWEDLVGIRVGKKRVARLMREIGILKIRRCALETRNIFIDASIFIGKNYNYRNTDFEQLSRLAQSNQANVFVTDITIREVKAHIETDISTAISALKKFQKETKVRVLKTLTTHQLKNFFRK